MNTPNGTSRLPRRRFTEVLELGPSLVFDTTSPNSANHVANQGLVPGLRLSVRVVQLDTSSGGTELSVLGLGMREQDQGIGYCAWQESNLQRPIQQSHRRFGIAPGQRKRRTLIRHLRVGRGGPSGQQPVQVVRRGRKVFQQARGRGSQ
jgi:hypothetical protein